MVNACQFLPRDRDLRRAASQGVRSVVGFQGPIFLDSGGYQFAQSGTVEVDLDHLVDFYNSSGATYAAALDIPLSPTASNAENWRRWDRTAKNTRRLRRVVTGPQLVPILHTYSPAAVARRLSQIGVNEIRTQLVGIGSLVPLLQGKHLGSRPWKRGQFVGAAARWCMMAEILSTIRRRNPRQLIHAFGVGSPATMLMMFALGVNSIDSVAWRIKAAFGDIFVKGFPARSVSTRGPTGSKRRRLGGVEAAALLACNCSCCHELPLPARIRALAHCYRARAVHNAHTLVSEARAMQEAREQLELVAFVRARMVHHHRLLRVFDKVILPRFTESEVAGGV